MTKAEARRYNWEFLRRSHEYRDDWRDLTEWSHDRLPNRIQSKIERDEAIDIELLRKLRANDEIVVGIQCQIEDFCLKWSISEPVEPTLQVLPRSVDFSPASSRVWFKSFSELDKERRSVSGDLLRQTTRFHTSSSNREKRYMAVVAVDLRNFTKASLDPILNQIVGHVRTLPKDREVKEKPGRFDLLLEMIDFGLSRASDLTNRRTKGKVDSWARRLAGGSGYHSSRFMKQVKQDLEAAEDLLRRAPLIPFKS